MVLPVSVCLRTDGGWSISLVSDVDDVVLSVEMTDGDFAGGFRFVFRLLAMAYRAEWLVLQDWSARHPVQVVVLPRGAAARERGIGALSVRSARRMILPRGG